MRMEGTCNSAHLN